MTFSYHEVGAISPGDTIAVPFGFLDRSHISVDVDGVVVANWEWINNGLIKATAGIPLGATTKVYRTTPLTSLPSTLQGASVFDWEGVNLNDLQALFVLQEYVDKEEERNASIEFIKEIAEALDTSVEELAETILPALALKADKESPALTGSPTTPTPATDAPDFVIANMEAVRRAFNAITKTSLGLGSVDNVSAANLRDRATHTGTQGADTITETGSRKIMTDVERTKLAGIAAGATVNSTDANLRNRATHTGTQAMSTITGLADALLQKASHADVAEAVAGVIDSSPAALDTLMELSTALGNDPNFSATISTALGNRLRVDLSQSLTETQKNQAAANLGIAPGATANDTDAALRARSSHTGTQSADTIVDSGTKVLMTPTERTKLGGIASGATANATDAALRARSSHTGTQSADTITDSATKVLMTSTERTKLGGVASGATANDTDANLKNRANHTGTQGVDTIFGIGEWVEDRVAGLLKAGPNITLTYDDAGNELTIGASGTVSTAASSVTVSAITNLDATNAQAAFAELQGDMDLALNGNRAYDRIFRDSYGTYFGATAVDFDTIVDRGLYVVTGSTNAPPNGTPGGFWHVSVYRVYGSQHMIQIAMPYMGSTTSASKMWYRGKNVSGAFGPWTLMSTTFGTTAGTSAEGNDPRIANAVQNTGGRINGNVIIRRPLDANAGVLAFQSNDFLEDWYVGMRGATTDFSISRYGTDGLYVDQPFTISQTTGEVKLGTANTPSTSLGGHKWSKSISIEGQDLNNLLDSGRYSGASLTNLPYASTASWYVDADRWNTSGGYVRQYAIPVESAYPDTGWVRKREGGSGWRPWYPQCGFISPEHFGAVGNGVADDSDAVELALRFNAPVVLRGYYRITRPITFGQGYNPAVCIQGKGARHFFLDSATAGLVFETGSAGVVGANRQIVARDFIGICNRSDHTAALLKVNGGTGSGSTEKTFDIRNVHSFGADHTKGTLYGIHLHNGRNGVIDGTVHQGKRNGTPGSMEGAAVYLTGGEDPVGINITNWKAYFTQAGVSVQDTHEGIEISSGEAVMVDYGVLADLDETTPSGPDDGKPLLKVTNNHFNVHVAGVHMTDVRDYNIANNDFLFQGAGEKIGIWSEARSSSTLYGDISGNKFDGANSTGPVTGVWFQGYSGGGVMGVHVGVNRYVLLAYGLYIGDHARGITFSGASQYAAVGTPVYWAASTSSISRYGVPAAV